MPLLPETMPRVLHTMPKGWARAPLSSSRSLPPCTKDEGVKRFGAEAILYGEMLEAASSEARRIEQECGLTYIHPYDDLHGLSGQRTIGLELAEDGPEFDDVAIPIGGGGLFAGIATTLAEVMPNARLRGVEAALYPSMHAALNGLEAPGAAPTIAEGIALEAPGKLTLPIIRERVDKIILVHEGFLEIAVETFCEIERKPLSRARVPPRWGPCWRSLNASGGGECVSFFLLAILML